MPSTEGYEDRTNHVCPHCGYQAPGAKTYKFHLERVKCGDRPEPPEAELRRLIIEQREDDRTYHLGTVRYHGGARLLSLDEAIATDPRGRSFSLLDLIADPTFG